MLKRMAVRVHRRKSSNVFRVFRGEVRFELGLEECEGMSSRDTHRPARSQENSVWV